jgi:2-polyprenyl-6-methoxyphenol hydroxylase and related FAD-dependent oxidoreductases
MVCSLTTDEGGCLADTYQDTEAGRVTLEDGTVCTGDLIIGADGIHVRKIARQPLQFLTNNSSLAPYGASPAMKRERRTPARTVSDFWFPYRKCRLIL